MAKRDRGTPQTEYQVLEDRVVSLERMVRQLQSAHRTSFTTTDTTKHLDPVQGETAINYPGTHPIATNKDGAAYYHDGEWRTFGFTSLPTFRGRLDDHFVEVGTNNQEPLEYDWWEWNADAIYDEGAFNGDYLQSWIVTTPGLYMINAAIWWDEPVVNWTTTLILNDPWRNSVVSHGHTSNAFDDYYSLCVLRDYYVFDPLANFFDPNNPPSSIEMMLQVNQNSGSAQNIRQGNILVVRLPDMDIHTPTNDIGSPWPPGRIIDGGW